jgi:fructokinase
MRALVVGEALIDLIVDPSGNITAVPGGGPFNTCRAIARLGGDVTFGGRISDDVFGRQIGALLTGDAVDMALPSRPALLTTLALAELDDAGAATYRFYTEGTAAPAVEPGELDVDDQISIVSIGTLGLVLEPLATAAEDLVGTLPADTLLFLDPNCRPLTVEDPAAYRARVFRIVERADVVKVSGDDLDYLFPDLDHRSAVQHLLDLGARLVLFTNGADSVVALTSGWQIERVVPPIEVVDSVGAGDAFGGAFIAYWLRYALDRDSLADSALVQAAVDQSITVAGVTCQRAGASPPLLAELSSMGVAL